MSQFKKNGTMELETSIGYSFSLIKTEYKQNKIYQNKKKTKRTVNLSFQSALCQQSEKSFCSFFTCGVYPRSIYLRLPGLLLTMWYNKNPMPTEKVISVNEVTPPVDAKPHRLTIQINM